MTHTKTETAAADFEDALASNEAVAWNAAHPVGTPVLAWPGTRDDEPLVTRTRTPAWTLGHGAAVVSVEGRSGGIALTHIQPVEDVSRG
jgi:hypothetical protein